MNMKDAFKLLKNFRGRKMFPITCQKCNMTMHNLKDATEHYHKCKDIQQETHQVMQEYEDSKK